MASETKTEETKTEVPSNLIPKSPNNDSGKSEKGQNDSKEGQKDSKKGQKEEKQGQNGDKIGTIPQGDCVVCGKLAKSFCSICKHVFYCRRECQRQHWNSHKEDCKILAKLPYRVKFLFHLQACVLLS